MMPGFIPRLQEEIVRAVAEPVTKPRPWKNGKRPPPPYDKFKALRPLTAFFAILNNPSPSVPRSDRAAANAGKAPGFAPAALPWIGGSLSGYVHLSPSLRLMDLLRTFQCFEDWRGRDLAREMGSTVRKGECGRKHGHGCGHDRAHGEHLA